MTWRTRPKQPRGPRPAASSHSYGPGSPWIFNGFDLAVPAGGHVVLRGPSGSGKSTLLKLVAQLHPPARGEIRLGGLHPGLVRARIAYLPQFVALFNGSILENLRLFSGGAGRRDLMEACEKTGLAALAATLPMGFETLVSSGGVNFSGGQRQLIALTAVLASRRQVLLLDEAMANLDSLAKAALFDSGLFQGKTVLLASHEPATGPFGPENRGFRRADLGTRMTA